MAGATTTGPLWLVFVALALALCIIGLVAEGCTFSALMDTNGGGVNEDRHSTPDNNCGSGSSPSCAPIRRTENRNIRGLNNQTPPPTLWVYLISMGELAMKLCLGYWFLLTP